MKSALVIDDSQNARRHVRQILEPWGFDIVDADGGASAIAVLRQRSFDIIFLDMEMPVLDGVATLRALRAMGVKTPVALVTAHVVVKDIADAVKSGAAEFVFKPATADAVRAVTIKMLGYEPLRVTAIRPRLLLVDCDLNSGDVARLGPCDVVVTRTFSDTVDAADEGVFDAIVLGRLDASGQDADDAGAEAEALASLLAQQQPQARLFQLVDDGADLDAVTAPIAAAIPRGLKKDDVDDILWRRSLGMLGYLDGPVIRLGRFTGEAVDLPWYEATQRRSIEAVAATSPTGVVIDISLVPAPEVEQLAARLVQLRNDFEANGTEIEFRAPRRLVDQLEGFLSAAGIPIRAL
jgi:CheY-like chemotaxis protein